MKKAKLWVVVADGSSARILSRRLEDGRLETVETLSSQAARDRPSEQGSDRPPRGKASAGTHRYAIEDSPDLQEKAKAAFAKAVAARLDAGAAAGEFDALVVAAPPRVLVALKAGLGTTAADALTREVTKDLTELPDHEIEHRLFATARF
jgi:protein required for attachment to host cells